MRIPGRIRKGIGGVVAGASALVLILTGGSAAAAVPIGQPMAGEMTYYNDVGYGACGTPIDASTQYLVAVSYQWWTAANPNDDPLCQGISVQVTYNGHTLTVPVADKCPTCDASHIDLSQPAFAEFAPLGTGVVTGITWQFVSSRGSTPPPTTSGGGDGSGGGTGGGGTGCPSPWSASTSYVPGDVVSYSGHKYTATYYSTGAVPNDPASWAVWADNGTC